MSPVLIQITLQAGYAILTVAGLSFIGLGIRVPTAEWGVMINMGLMYIIDRAVVGGVLPGNGDRDRDPGLQPAR